MASCPRKQHGADHSHYRRSTHTRRSRRTYFQSIRFDGIMRKFLGPDRYLANRRRQARPAEIARTGETAASYCRHYGWQRALGRRTRPAARCWASGRNRKPARCNAILAGTRNWISHALWARRRTGSARNGKFPCSFGFL